MRNRYGNEYEFVKLDENDPEDLEIMQKIIDAEDSERKLQ